VELLDVIRGTHYVPRMEPLGAAKPRLKNTDLESVQCGVPWSAI